MQSLVSIQINPLCEAKFALFALVGSVSFVKLLVSSHDVMKSEFFTADAALERSLSGVCSPMTRQLGKAMTQFAAELKQYNLILLSTKLRALSQLKNHCHV